MLMFPLLVTPSHSDLDWPGGCNRGHDGENLSICPAYDGAWLRELLID